MAEVGGGGSALPQPRVQPLLQHPPSSPFVFTPWIRQVLTTGQELTFEFQGLNFLLRANTLTVVAGARGEQAAVPRAALSALTTFVFETRKGGGVKVTGQKSIATSQLFRQKDVSFEKLGIGGLDAQFREMFRRAFESRRLPPSVVERLGIKHRKGILLFGPPGAALEIWGVRVCVCVLPRG